MTHPQTRFLSVKVAGNSLIGQRRNAAKKSTLLYQLDVLKKTGRYDAFKLEWKDIYSQEPTVWPIPDHLFWDSDVAKWIEGACYYLQEEFLPEVDAAVKEMVEMIRSAQQPDGYLNIHYTLVEPTKRFTNLRDMHELYNAGHLIEAALAHNQLYKNDRLMEPINKYADLLYDTFGPGPNQVHGYPGHPEIELALLRLYERTGNTKHLALAKYFVLERGNPTGVNGRPYYVTEAEMRGEDERYMPHYYPKPMSLWYHQAHKPIVEQDSIEGHSVRAMYLLTAAADLAAHDDSKDCADLKRAVLRLWENMTCRKMYVTGGIGAIEQWEGFGIDYFLPQGTDEGGCYAETCAAIGVMMLAERILKFDRDARYSDVMELCLYNAVLTAMSWDGKAFTYVNQLASSDANPSKREDWFTVACCPPNLLRTLGQIGGYIWAYDANEKTRRASIDVHLYVPSTLRFNVGEEEIEVRQDNKWPWDGDISFEVRSSVEDISLNLRIPGWSSGYILEPAYPAATVEKGYLSLPADYVTTNKSFKLSIPLEAEWVIQNPLAGRNIVSLKRGPIVYCVEDIDNAWVHYHFRGTFVDINGRLTQSTVKDDHTGDEYVGLSLENGTKMLDIAQSQTGASMSERDFREQLDAGKDIKELHFVPYYFRANRAGKGHMRVGLQRQ
ncbi:hypothetical protein SLS60_007235 [Paraconiothyrium brasiliense]|uniref:Glycoside hydrolase family 127 protein n=1 Tax=Paraconiothyrium brasiliense TaxID=300254 RepID=A0ABR3R941_9PLEO